MDGYCWPGRGGKKAGYDLFINSFEKNQEIPACVEQQKVSGLIVG